MSDDLKKWTWDKDDVEWETVPDPNAKPLIPAEQLDEARKRLRELNGEETGA